MRTFAIAVSVALAPIAPRTLAAQTSASALIERAHARLSVNDLDSADVLLKAVLTSATQRTDSATALAWGGILAFMRGDEPATRTAFHHALQLGASLTVQDLARAAPRLAELYQEERQALVVYVSADVEEKPRRLSGPRVAYPLNLVRRQVRGRAMVAFIVDTLGHVDSSSIDIVATPDSGMEAPLREMILASTFAPGRVHGRPVRTLMELAIDLEPGTPPNATTLVNAARSKLAVQALRVGGTVTVEATIDTTGHVVPGSVKVFQSPNPGLDAEARRVVTAAVYRPGRRAGRPVATVIRQTITFAPY